MKKIQIQIVTFIAIMAGYIGLVYAGFCVYDNHMHNESMRKLHEVMNNDRYYHYESIEERLKTSANEPMLRNFEFVNMGGWYEIKNWPWYISYIERGYKGEIRHYFMVPTAVTIQSWMNSVDKDYIIDCLITAYNNCVNESGDSPVASYNEMDAICKKFTDGARNSLYFVKWNYMPNENLNEIKWIKVGFSSVKVEIKCSGINELTRIYSFEDTRNNYLLIGVLVIAIVGLFVIGTSYSEYYSNQKKIKSTLHYRLLTACNPSNFIKPYNKEIIDIANSIYQQILSTSPTDHVKLKNLRSKVTKELGISFIDTKELNEYKQKCNPSRFMNPYNPNKVAQSNEFLSRLSSDNLTIDEFEELKEKINKL